MLRTGSNTTDINRFGSHTGNVYALSFVSLVDWKCNIAKSAPKRKNIVIRKYRKHNIIKEEFHGVFFRELRYITLLYIPKILFLNFLVLFRFQEEKRILLHRISKVEKKHYRKSG